MVLKPVGLYRGSEGGTGLGTRDRGLLPSLRTVYIYALVYMQWTEHLLKEGIRGNQVSGAVGPIPPRKLTATPLSLGSRSGLWTVKGSRENSGMQRRLIKQRGNAC